MSECSGGVGWLSLVMTAFMGRVVLVAARGECNGRRDDDHELSMGDMF